MAAGSYLPSSVLRAMVGLGDNLVKVATNRSAASPLSSPERPRVPRGSPPPSPWPNLARILSQKTSRSLVTFHVEEDTDDDVSSKDSSPHQPAAASLRERAAPTAHSRAGSYSESVGSNVGGEVVRTPNGTTSEVAKVLVLAEEEEHARVGRCKLDPGLKAHPVSKVQPNEDNICFQLEPEF